MRESNNIDSQQYRDRQCASFVYCGRECTADRISPFGHVSNNTSCKRVPAAPKINKTALKSKQATYCLILSVIMITSKTTF